MTARRLPTGRTYPDAVLGQPVRCAGTVPHDTFRALLGETRRAVVLRVDRWHPLTAGSWLVVFDAGPNAPGTRHPRRLAVRVTDVQPVGAHRLSAHGSRRATELAVVSVRLLLGPERHAWDAAWAEVDAARNADRITATEDAA